MGNLPERIRAFLTSFKTSHSLLGLVGAVAQREEGQLAAKFTNNSGNNRAWTMVSMTFDFLPTTIVGVAGEILVRTENGDFEFSEADVSPDLRLQFTAVVAMLLQVVVLQNVPPAN